MGMSYKNVSVSLIYPKVELFGLYFCYHYLQHNTGLKFI